AIRRLKQHIALLVAKQSVIGSQVDKLRQEFGNALHQGRIASKIIQNRLTPCQHTWIGQQATQRLPDERRVAAVRAQGIHQAIQVQVLHSCGRQLALWPSAVRPHQADNRYIIRWPGGPHGIAHHLIPDTIWAKWKIVEMKRTWPRRGSAEVAKA